MGPEQMWHIHMHGEHCHMPSSDASCQWLCRSQKGAEMALRCRSMGMAEWP